jgi:glutathione S-transferase
VLSDAAHATLWLNMPVTMTPTITAFERSPDGGMGLARDTRVRWALEEVRQSYNVVAFHSLR